MEIKGPEGWLMLPSFVSLLQEASEGIQTTFVINFRDTNYGPETGGFHPVEMMINSKGEFDYVTDFCYVGRPPTHELIKKIDFDFENKNFIHFGTYFPIQSGAGLWKIWQENFITYHKMGVYETSIQGLF